MYELPTNTFKRAIVEGRQQIGLWCSLQDPGVVEMLSRVGYDWLLLDGEHTSASLETTLAQLRAGAGGTASLIVRAVQNDTALIKQYLDMGVQTLLLPMINSAEEAERAVRAMRYPPRGVRGVASATRASRFGRIPDYHVRAEAELCLLVQVETAEALGNLEEIAAVDGVDGIFIGPSDLSAGLGFLGQPLHPEAVEAIGKAIGRIRTAGKPAGVLSVNEPFLRKCIDWGTTFTAVGTDVALLLGGAEALAAKFRD